MSDIPSTDTTVSQASLIETIIARIQAIIEDAEQATQPLELEPHRGHLFELFVMADGASLINESVDPNLSSDAIAAELATRWNLRNAAANSMHAQEKMANTDLSKMRLLWSFLRMWMEWSYAWGRWREFHEGK